jgi:serine/threonine-protein kinase
MVHVNGHDPAGAVPILRKTLVVAPIMAKAHEILGRILSDAGALDQAVERLEASLKLDPTHTEPRYDLARAHALLGNWDEADQLLALPIDEGPTEITGTFARLRLGLWRRGVLRPGGAPPEGAPLDPDPPRSVIRAWEWLHATGRLHSQHHTFFQEMTASQSPRLRSVLAQFYTEALAAGGDTYGARGALEIAVDAGLYDVSWMDRCPLLDRLRGDAPWHDLLERVRGRASAITRALGEEPAGRGTPTPRG